MIITVSRFLLISKSCDDCGCKVAVKLFDKKPTKEQIKENEDVIGGTYCIATKTIELDENKAGQAEMYD